MVMFHSFLYVYQAGYHGELEGNYWRSSGDSTTTWWMRFSYNLMDQLEKIRNIFVLKAGISIYETAREMMLINTNRCGVFLYVFLNWHWGCWQWPCVAVILDFMRTNWLICGAPSPGTTLLYFPMMLKVHTIDGWWILMRTQWDCKTNTLW